MIFANIAKRILKNFHVTNVLIIVGQKNKWRSDYNMDTLEKYVKEKHPDIEKEYIRFINRNHLPKIGDKVVTLRRGFGAGAGRVLNVKEIDERSIILTDGEDDYISFLENWYMDIDVLGN